MVRNKVREKENRKQIDLARSLSSTSRSTQGWEPTGFQAKVDWISVLTGPEKDWQRSVTLQTSLLPVFGPNRGSLWPILKNEKPIEERNQPRRAVKWKCLCRLLVRPLRPNLRPFFSSLVATLATKHFPATTKYHYCSESFPTRPSRDENR